MDERQFPILPGNSRTPRPPGAPKSVPWRLVAPHEKQAEANHGQSLRRLAERGGLSWRELAAVMLGRRFQGAPDTEETAFRVVQRLASASFITVGEGLPEPASSLPRDGHAVLRARDEAAIAMRQMRQAGGIASHELAERVAATFLLALPAAVFGPYGGAEMAADTHALARSILARPRARPPEGEG